MLPQEPLVGPSAIDTRLPPTSSGVLRELVRTLRTSVHSSFGILLPWAPGPPGDRRYIANLVAWTDLRRHYTVQPWRSPDSHFVPGATLTSTSTGPSLFRQLIAGFAFPRRRRNGATIDDDKSAR